MASLTLAAGACVALAILTTSQNVLVTWSQRQGGYEYNYVSVTLMSEVVKFVIAAFLLVRQERGRRSAINTARPSSKGDDSSRGGGGGGGSIARASSKGDVESGASAPAAASAATSPVDLSHELSAAGFVERLPYAVPAFAYFLKNNMMFYGLKFLNPVQFQLLGNLKIPATAVLYYLMMKKPLSDLAWLAVLLLTIGLTVTQLKGDQEVAITVSSVLVMSVISLLSAFGAIATEWLMKSSATRAAESLHIQNLWLYFYGILFNLLAIVMDDWDALWADGFFYGYPQKKCLFQMYYI